jgi:hypothetical protein
MWVDSISYLGWASRRPQTAPLTSGLHRSSDVNFYDFSILENNFLKMVRFKDNQNNIREISTVKKENETGQKENVKGKKMTLPWAVHTLSEC